LLRLAQNRSEAAAAAIRRIVDETTGSLERTKLLPAYVEIMLALGETDDARAACRELEGIAQEYDAEVFRAMAAHARGAVNLAGDDAPAALGPLRDAWRLWRQVKVPYLAARVRVLIGLACREIGDEDGSRLELAAARAEFEQLGASPDIDIVDLHTKLALARNAGGLTRRELQVLRLVANGKTNKAIASELSVSQKTIDRHLSNIFTKLDVPSRAAATAYVYEHNLLHD
jgi:ATP/maltotriose-dependent transcriptional regulator MalT